MYTEQQREYMRELLLAAMADYNQRVGGGTDASAIIQTQGYEHVANAMNCQQSRPRGTSKENCSPDVFDHLKVLRCVNDLQALQKKWIKYRYSENKSEVLEADLIEVAIGDLEYFAGRPQKVDNLRKMVEKLIVSRREFVETQQKDITEAMSVNRKTFFRRYRAHCNETSEYLNQLDAQSLDAMLYIFGEKPYKMNL